MDGRWGTSPVRPCLSPGAANGNVPALFPAANGGRYLISLVAVVPFRSRRQQRHLAMIIAPWLSHALLCTTEPGHGHEEVATLGKYELKPRGSGALTRREWTRRLV